MLLHFVALVAADAGVRVVAADHKHTDYAKSMVPDQS